MSMTFKMVKLNNIHREAIIVNGEKLKADEWKKKQWIHNADDAIVNVIVIRCDCKFLIKIWHSLFACFFPQVSWTQIPIVMPDHQQIMV